MRLVFMGSPQYACLPLEYLLLHGKEHEVCLVVSQPGKVTGRGRQKAAEDPPVVSFARARGLRILQPESAKDPGFLQELRAVSPDVIITAAYGQILSDEFLSIPKCATINIHPSRLPAFRGATPVQSAILAGDTDTAVTVLFTVKKLDAGNIIVAKDFPLPEHETAPQALVRLFSESGPLLLQALKKLAQVDFVGQVQDDASVTKCGKIDKEDGLINWQQLTRTEVINRFRAYHLWPSCYTYFFGKRLIIEEMGLIQDESSFNHLQPGDFIFAKSIKLRDASNAHVLVVACKDGVVAIKQVKLEGSSSCDALAFSNRLDKNKTNTFLR